MNHNQNSFKGGYIRDYVRDYYRGRLRGIVGVQTIAVQVHGEDIGVFILLVPSALATTMSADGALHATPESKVAIMAV